MRGIRVGQGIYLYGILVVVVVGVLAALISTNLVLRSIERNLPVTLLGELNALDEELREVATLVTLSEAAGLDPTADRFNHLQAAIQAGSQSLARFRDQYVADNLIKASVFHGVVAPALADLLTWSREGAGGYPIHSPETAQIMHGRILEAHDQADQVMLESRRQARAILDAQRQRIDAFLFRVNQLFVLIVALTSGLVVLVYRLQLAYREERRVKNTLRRQGELLNGLFDSVLFGILIADAEDRILMINRGFIRLTGYQKQQLTTLAAWVELALPDGQERERMLELWHGQGVAENEVAEFTIRCHDQGVKEIEFRPTALADGRSVGIVIDVSERKRNERALRLEQEIRDRSRKMESLGLLAGGVAHDLNNILSGIVSYPELMLMDIDPDSRTGKKIQLIQRAGEKAAAIVQDLLTLARRGVATTEVVDLELVITDYMETGEFRTLLERYCKVLIETDFQAANPYVVGSSVHLSKVVMNLIVNAAEAIEEAGLIKVSLFNRTLSEGTVEQLAAGQYVVLVVEDTGIGIPTKDLKHIFEPFYTTKVMGKSGSGLGMAVVWGTVKDHGGWIDVHSSPGEGCRVEIYLPASDLRPEPAQGRIPVERYQGSERILVVDDVEEQRQIARDILSRLGYTVFTAGSGEEAVAWLGQHQVDLVLLDMIMEPGMDGLSTYRAILELCPGQKALLASGYAETTQVQEALQLGAGRYLKKPYSLEKIGLAIRLELDGQAHQH